MTTDPVCGMSIDPNDAPGKSEIKVRPCTFVLRVASGSSIKTRRPT